MSKPQTFEEWEADHPFRALEEAHEWVGLAISTKVLLHTQIADLVRRERRLAQVRRPQKRLPAPYQYIDIDCADLSMRILSRPPRAGGGGVMNWYGNTFTCEECGREFKYGNRRTPQSRRNWRKYILGRHICKPKDTPTARASRRVDAPD
jgi:hypothetical protein